MKHLEFYLTVMIFTGLSMMMNSYPYKTHLVSKPFIQRKAHRKICPMQVAAMKRVGQ